MIKLTSTTVPQPAFIEPGQIAAIVPYENGTVIWLRDNRSVQVAETSQEVYELLEES